MWAVLGFAGAIGLGATAICLAITPESGRVATTVRPTPLSHHCDRDTHAREWRPSALISETELASGDFAQLEEGRGVARSLPSHPSR